MRCNTVNANINKIITVLLGAIRTIEKFLLRFLNQSGHTYDSWDDFMNSLTTTAPDTSAEDSTVPSVTGE